MRLLLALVASVAAACIAAMTAGSGMGAAQCPKIGFVKRVISGVAAQVHCGPATATVTLNGKKIRFAGGTCEASGKSFDVYIGTFTDGQKKPKWKFFALATYTKPHGKRLVALAFHVPGEVYQILPSPKLVLSGTSRGRFSGRAYPMMHFNPHKSVVIKGTFSCNQASV